MSIKTSPCYFQKDPKEKGVKYAQEMVQLMRSEWTPLVDVPERKIAMDYLLTRQSLESLKRSFKKGKSWVDNNKWIPIAIYDRIRNILIAEFLKGAYSPFVEATDVSAEIQRKKDRTLLKGRPIIEGAMNDLNRRIGDPPYKMPADKFEGNVEAFDEMGLDDRSQSHINFFMEGMHRLWHEADSQTLLRGLMKLNEFENHVEDIVNDILASATVSFQCVVSPYSGQIKWKYLNPSHVKLIPGERKDGKDATCKGFEKNVSVRQFLEFCGPEFDWNNETHRAALTMGLNACNGTTYHSVDKNGCYDYIPNPDGEGLIMRQVADYQTLIKSKIGVGYMEWKSVDAIGHKKDKKTGLFYDLKDDDPDEYPDTSRYTKEMREYQRTYTSWFMGNGHFIFRFRPLYHQITYGADDEYSSFSIITLMAAGRPAVKLTESFVDAANLAFQKMMWAIHESNPRKRVYNVDTLLSLVKHINPTDDQQRDAANPGALSQVNQMLAMYKDSLYEMYATPEIAGQKAPGAQRPNYWDEGGIDPLAPAMQTVLDWAEAQVSARLGLNSLRDASTPDPKDGFKLGMEAIKQSRNATYYIPGMIENILKNTCTISLNICQDAIELRKTTVYTFLETFLGPDSMSSFRALNKIPLHRYATNVEIFNGQDRREETKQDAQLAFQRGDISYGQYLMIREMDDHKRAGMWLEFYRQESERKKAEEAELAHKRALEIQDAKRDGELQVIDAKGHWEIEREKERGKYYMSAHQTPSDAAIIRKQMDIDSNAQKLRERTDEDIRKEEHKKALEAQEPLPPVEVSQ